MTFRPAERRGWRALAWILTTLLLATALTGCFGRRRHQPRNQEAPAAFQPVESHRIRMLAADGTDMGAFRVSRRAAQVFSANGVRIARARRLHDRVEVLSRHGSPVLLIRGEDPGEGARQRAIGNLELPDGTGVGQLMIDADDNIVLYGPVPDRLQRGEVLSLDNEGERSAEIYGAPGTDLVARVQRSGPREVRLTDASDAVIARLIGDRLEPWLIGALCFESPLEGEHAEQYFRVGLLAYLTGLP